MEIHLEANKRCSYIYKSPENGPFTTGDGYCFNAFFLPTMTAYVLTHWGWVTHTCIRNLKIFGSDNGLSVRRQSTIWTNVGILLIGP